MPSRSLAVLKLQYHPRRKPDKLADVAALPDSLDLLDLLHGVLNLPPAALRSEEKFEDCAVLDIQRFGRVVLADLESGHYGEPGRAKNVDTGTITHAITERESTPVDTRLAAYVPKRGRYALLFLETTVGSKVRARFLDLTHRVWSKRYPEWVLTTTAVVHGHDWIQKAELESVVATIQGWSPDIGDGNQQKKVGNLAHTIVPVSGDRFLPRRLFERLMDQKLKRGAVLGLPDAQEPDEVKVQMTYNGQSKTFVLDNARTPPVRIHLSDHGEERLGDALFLRQCDDEAKRFFGAEKVDWRASWSTGTGSADNVPDLEVPGECEDLDEADSS